MRMGGLSTTLLEDGTRPFHMRGHVNGSELGNSHRNVLKSNARSSRLGNSTPDFGNPLGLGECFRES
jgi:hypothetical protein